MPSVDFTAENKVSQGPDLSFPTLKFVKDERKRVLAIETKPTFEYTHRLVMPKIVNGVVQMERKNRKDGSEYEVYATDFIGLQICHGDLGAIANSGADPDNCPMCALALENSDAMLPPIRRFAMHTVVYSTKPGTFEVANPFQVGIVVWKFTDKTYNSLVDIKNEWGDLRKIDLNLGPCTNLAFQQFDINVGSQAAWLQDEARRNLVVATYQSNRAADLSAYCGRRSELRWVQADIEKIKQRWREVAAINAGGIPTYGQQAYTPGADPSLAAGLAGLLDPGTLPPAQAHAPAPVPSAASAEAALPDLDALFGGAAPTPVTAGLVTDAANLVPNGPGVMTNPEALTTAPVMHAPVPQAAPAPVPAQGDLGDLLAMAPTGVAEAPGKPGSSGEVIDFDDILGAIN